MCGSSKRSLLPGRDDHQFYFRTQLRLVGIYYCFFFIQQTRNAEVSKYLSSIKQNARFSPCDRFFSDISCTSLKVKKEIKKNSLRHAEQAKTAKYKRCELNRVEHL